MRTDNLQKTSFKMKRKWGVHNRTPLKYVQSRISGQKNLGLRKAPSILTEQFGELIYIAGDAHRPVMDDRISVCATAGIRFHSIEKHVVQNPKNRSICTAMYVCGRSKSPSDLSCGI